MNTSFLDTGNIQMSDLNPLKTNVKRTYANRLTDVKFEGHEEVSTWNDLIKNINSDVKFYNYKFDDELYVPVDLSAHEVFVAEKTTENQADKNVVVKQNTSGHIHLIAGCFSSKSNANTLISELKTQGFEARILDKNKGLFRVSAGSFSSSTTAKKAKTNLADLSFSSWILKK
jgi:hypothetical protein